MMKSYLILVLFVNIFGTVLCRQISEAIKRNSKESFTSIGSFEKKNINITLINIKIHIDNVLLESLKKQYGRQTRKKIKGLVKKLVLDVEKIFRYLDGNIEFSLLNTKFLKNNSNLVEINENGSKYLKGYCKWQAEKKKNSWYYSVLLTGLDLFYINEEGIKNLKSTGRGYMNGICSISHSCTLLEWHPKIISFLLAHEIAHSLGISHDGPPHNHCKARGNMMGAKYNAEKHPKSWSNCSKRDLKKFLTNDKAWCLRPDLSVGN